MMVQRLAYHLMVNGWLGNEKKKKKKKKKFINPPEVYYKFQKSVCVVSKITR